MGEVDLADMTGIKKRRRESSQDNTSASSVDSRPASQENAAYIGTDSRPTSQKNVAASAMDSRPGLPHNTSASALDSRPVSSFEFSVISEEGINLYVDMNSSLVDWHKGLGNGICVCQCPEEKKYQSFREELLYLGNNRKQTNGSFGCKSDSRLKDSSASLVSSPTFVNKRSDNLLLNHPDAKNEYLDVFAAEACSFDQEESECLEEQKEHPNSISCNLYVDGMMSSPKPEKIGSMCPNALHVHLGKIASSSMESLATVGPQTTVNDKNMKLHGEISTDVKIKMRQIKQNAMPPSVSSGIASESKLSEDSCPEKDPPCCAFVNDPSLNLIGAAQSVETGIVKLAKTIENEHHTHLNILSAKDQASSSPISGTEASRKSEQVMSEGGHKRRRYKSLLDKVSLQFSGRILRSAVRPRRSQRLVSKVVTP